MYYAYKFFEFKNDFVDTSSSTHTQIKHWVEWTWRWWCEKSKNWVNRNVHR